METLYMVEHCVYSMPCKINVIPELRVDMKISWADGMVGAMPVFISRKDAEKYAKNNGMNAEKVIEIGVVKKCT